jgi:hypothetical protein
MLAVVLRGGHVLPVLDQALQVPRRCVQVCFDSLLVHDPECRMATHRVK